MCKSFNPLNNPVSEGLSNPILRKRQVRPREVSGLTLESQGLASLTDVPVYVANKKKRWYLSAS